MKKYLLFSVAALFLLLAEAHAQADGAVITFKEKEVDYGDIKHGEKVTHVFTFENTGKQPLVISNVAASCGCTTPQWPKEPILPGKTGEMKVVFDSTGKRGAQKATVRIYSNATEPIERIAIITNVMTR
ncbi:MAG: DUF1573 domain-containing protein [Nitritalea sp.]